MEVRKVRWLALILSVAVTGATCGCGPRLVADWKPGCPPSVGIKIHNPPAWTVDVFQRPPLTRELSYGRLYHNGDVIWEFRGQETFVLSENQWLWVIVGETPHGLLETVSFEMPAEPVSLCEFEWGLTTASHGDIPLKVVPRLPVCF